MKVKTLIDSLTHKVIIIWRFDDIETALKWLQTNPKTGKLTIHVSQGTSGHAEFEFLAKIPIDKLIDS